MAVTDGVRQLETFFAVGKSTLLDANTTNTTANAYDFTVSNVIEGLWYTEPRKCFISAAERGGVVTIDIPWSMVTHVKLLNAKENGNNFFRRFLFITAGYFVLLKTCWVLDRILLTRNMKKILSFRLNSS